MCTSNAIYSNSLVSSAALSTITAYWDVLKISRGSSNLQQVYMAYLLQPNAVQTEFLQNVQKKVQINISIHYDYVSVC